MANKWRDIRRKFGAEGEERVKKMTAEILEEVTISREEYESLKRAAAMLAALQGAGVVNWEGYEVAQEMLED